MSKPAKLGNTELYREGVSLLLQGQAEEAIQALVAVAADGSREARLALGKAYLEVRDGTAAAVQFRTLLEDPPSDPGMLGYLHLLAASAAALADHTDIAEPHLDAAQAADPRMEHAARALRRRLRKGRPPVIRF